METIKYSVDYKNELLDELESTAAALFQSTGNIRDIAGERLKELKQLYRDCYNLVAIDLLIRKLKIPEHEARNMHLQAWQKQLTDSCGHPQKDFVRSYIQHLTDLASAYIQQAAGQSDETALSMMVFSSGNAEDCDNTIKQRWAFVWHYISKMDENTKKIFMYKLYGGLSFNDIASILKTNEDKVRTIYQETEASLFHSSSFKQFFNIR